MIRLSIILLFVSFSLIGCDNMRDGNRTKPYEENLMFQDGSSSRPLVNGVVARGYLRDNDAFYRGKTNDEFVSENPMLKREPNQRALIKRGADRYNIYCIVCHGATGLGDGLVVKKGFNQPPPFTDERLLNKEDGYLYDVITNGYGVMASYAAQLTPEDRWAVVAYLRWLQKEQKDTQ